MTYDFIIVGRGLAATTLMHVFTDHEISFKVIAKENMSSSSLVAGGIWNPIVFKRLTKSWMADELLPALNHFYSGCEARLQTKFVKQRKIVRPFLEQQEKELWQKKSMNELDDYLDPKIYDANRAPAICKVENGFGLVMGAGSIDMSEFLKKSADFFSESMVEEEFQYEDLRMEGEGVFYKNIKARNIVFCEGWLVKNNPYFSWVPLKPAKGEVLTVKINEQGLNDEIITKSAFLMGVKAGEYRVGATYEWNSLNEEPTEEARRDLESRLKNIIHCNYEVVTQKAGVRPSSIDRRPLIGQHPIHQHLYLFNGLGTKGVMLAPFFARNFVNYFLKGEHLNTEVNLSRFYHLFQKQIP